MKYILLKNNYVTNIGHQYYFHKYNTRITKNSQTFL
jgi:hypothetical protein